MTSPKLRFKGFDSKWNKYKISEVTEYLVDGTHFSPKSTDGDFKYITSKNIRNDGLDLTQISYISKEEHEVIYKRCKVQLGDILLTKDGANTGNCCLNTLDEEFSLLSSVAVLRGKQRQFDNNFILQILQSDIGQNTIISSMSGQAITRITLAKLKDYSFCFPHFEEQTKIASFLSAVDEKITQLSQKLHLLGQYKQGMMQKLFCQQLRFKADDGSDFREWETKTIKELNLYISDGNYGELYPTSAQFIANGIPFIRANNIKKLKISDIDMRFIDEDLHKILTSGHLKMDDIILTTRGDIGMLALVDSNHEGSNINAQICLLRVIDKLKINPAYLLYFLHSSFGHKQFKELQTGSALKQLPKKSLDKINTFVPCLEEQTKIANFLSAIDQKMDVVSEQLEQAKSWKKGLLQQMFV